ncbi:MAG: 4Fe-4S dicluster domain-containing protein, partial [Anaerolineales bacterium]|nr:4Fe-4S dicluster domain-containing protein [Anaerolineales bacterium]
MIERHLAIGSVVSLPKTELDALMAGLRQNDYQTVGPRLKDEGLVYAGIESLADLPRGVISEQAAGKFRLVQTGQERYFDIIPGGQSWKQFLFPPRQTLFTARKDGRWRITPDGEPAPRYALIGVRACELAAIEIQDRAFMREDYADPIYRARRRNLFIVAVNCLRPAGTCFCVSLGNGPRAERGYDLCLTELDDVFLVEIGSELGRSLMTDLACEPASAYLQNAANQGLEQAAKQMGRRLDTSDLPQLLTGNLDAERWEQVGKRCLSCANCTLVCPTCFCWDATDHTDLLGNVTRRERVWDSCFNPSFSYFAGGNTRPAIRSRYRQWLTHKLGAWKEQYGTLGCVGCGRCITWCPAGIDLTE